jgi:RNA polymerase sigma-70 factor (ECF subfamily)
MPSADPRSFEALAMPHLETLYRVARRLTRDAHEAEDLVQDTYYKAYRAFDRFEIREFGIKPWLLKILNNTFLNRRAREKHAPRSADQQSLDESQAGERSPLVDSPSLDFELLDQEVKQALEALAPEFRSVLLLWATNELSYQEIAAALDLPIGTVMSRLHRARAQLTRALAGFAQEQRIGPQ